MPSFAFESGHLVPAAFGRPSSGPLAPAVRAALREYLLDVIEADLFPIAWSGEDEPTLTAMDASGQVVTAVVADRIDADTLVRVLARAGENAAASWITVAGRYRSGVPGFRRDWNAFRESRPAGAQPGPQVYVVTGDVTPEVVAALRVLSDVRVVAVDVRETSHGQQLLDVTPVDPGNLRVLDGVSLPGPHTAPTLPVTGELTQVVAAGGAVRGGHDAAAVEPVVDEPVAVVDEPAAGAPVVGEPVVGAPVVGEPAVDEAVVGAPTDAVAEPVADEAAADPAQAASGRRRASGPPRASQNLRAVAELVEAPIPIVLQTEGAAGAHVATLREDGVVVLADGTEHGELGAATAEVLGAPGPRGREDVDVWAAWRFADGRYTLGEVRREAMRARPGPERTLAPGDLPSRRALRRREAGRREAAGQTSGR